MRTKIAPVAAAVLLLAAVLPSPALAGDVDPSFGGFGQAGVAQISVDGNLAGFAVQPDGKIVVTWETSGYDYGVARLTAQGQLDPTFSTDGVVIVDVGGANTTDHPRDIAVQDDGKIVVVGLTGPASGTGWHSGIIRLTSGGQLDTTFGTGGKYIYGGPGFDYALQVAMRPGGKILVGGQGTNPAGGDTSDFCLSRYLANGSLDTTFGGTGKVYADFDRSEIFNEMAVGPTGRIVVAGATLDASSHPRLAVAAFSADGAIDTGFGSGGMFTLPNAYRSDAAAIQPDGKILLSVGPGAWDLIRLQPNGVLDTSFGSGGGVALPGPYGVIDSLILQPDGKFYAGITGMTTGGGFTIARYNPDGSADQTFGTAGFLTTTFTGAFFGGEDKLLQPAPDGRLVAGGGLTTIAEPRRTTATVLRFFADGTLDAGGRVVANFGGYAGARADDLAVQPDGKILLTGTATGAETAWALARFTSTGAPDPAFGTAGRTAVRRGLADTARAAALAPDGKILVAGWVEKAADVDMMAGRFTADGAVDGTWGYGGWGVTAVDFSTPADPARNDYAVAAALQDDQKLVIAGQTEKDNYRDVALARFTAGGFLDTTFGTDGKVRTDLGTWYDVASAVAIQADGKIVAAGGRDGNFALERYLPDGAPDGSFGSGGKVVTDFGGNDVARSLVIDPRGRIVAAGFTSTGGGDFALARYRPDGSLDPTFGAAGKLTLSFDGQDDAFAIARRSHGLLAVAGYTAVPGGSVRRIALAVLLEDGPLSTDFGGGTGKAVFGFGSTADQATRVAFDMTGHILVGGYATQLGRQVFAVARFNAPLSPAVYLPVVRQGPGLP